MNIEADILIDNIRNPEVFWYGKLFVPDDFMQWAIAMLKLISEDQWLEESEKYYYEQFISKYKTILK